MLPKNLKASWRKGFLACAGCLVCFYELTVVCYVQSSPDIGIHCGFAPIINGVDEGHLRTNGELPRSGDTLVQVGTVPIEANPRLWSQVLILRALRGEDDPDVLRTVDGKKEIQIQLRSQ